MEHVQKTQEQMRTVDFLAVSADNTFVKDLYVWFKFSEYATFTMSELKGRLRVDRPFVNHFLKMRICRRTLESTPNPKNISKQ
eukprot:3050149-Amphidinium_carterae.1